MLEKTLDELRKNIVEVPHKLLSVSENEFSHKPSPNKWSKKEILGHLCDSAVNNYSRFIRLQFEPEPIDLRPYAQNEWNELNGYKDIPTKEIVLLWAALNTQLANIISRYPDDKLDLKCKYGDEMITAKFLIEDYVAHMNHHLGQIFD